MQRMGYNRIWYALLWVMLVMFLASIVRFDWLTLRLVLHRWSWGVLLSPAAYLYFTSLISTIFFPVQMLSVIPTYFDMKATGLYSRRYKWTLLTLVGICAGEFLILALIWGSFPLEVDSS